MTLAHIAAALDRNDPMELARLAVGLSMHPPEETRPGYAEEVCLRLARHADPNVRGNALLGFGHLARTAGVIRNADEVRALIEGGLADPDRYVSGQAEAAAGDLEHFLGWKLER